MGLQKLKVTKFRNSRNKGNFLEFQGTNEHTFEVFELTKDDVSPFERAGKSHIQESIQFITLHKTPIDLLREP